MKNSVRNALFNSYSYSEYKKLISDLLSQGKSTGKEQSEDLLQYSVLNEIRLKRLDQTICVPEEISNQLKELEKEYIWLTIVEGWCGDAAQILPILNKMALESTKIDLKIVLRDSNDELMTHFLDDESRAIPKLIMVDKESGEVCNHWGPKPKGVLDLIKSYNDEFSIVDAEVKRQLQLWYLRDKGLSVQNEIVEMMRSKKECLCV